MVNGDEPLDYFLTENLFTIILSLLDCSFPFFMQSFSILGQNTSFKKLENPRKEVEISLSCVEYGNLGLLRFPVFSC